MMHMRKLSNLRNRLSSLKMSSDLDKTIILDMVKRNPLALKNLSAYQDDKEVVMQAVSETGFAFQYASERLRNDKEVALEAISAYPVLKFLGDDLKEDPDIFLNAIKKNHFAYSMLPESLKDNKDIMLAMALIDGKFLKDASPRLRDNEQFILNAIKIAPWTIAYASPRLQNDFHFILNFFKFFPLRRKDQLSKFLGYLPNDIKEKITGNRLLMLEMIKKIGWLGYIVASKELQKDKDLVLEAIKKDKFISEISTPKEFLDDKELMLQAVSINGYNLALVSDRLKDDDEIVRTAIANQPKALWKASRRLQMKYRTSY